MAHRPVPGLIAAAAAAAVAAARLRAAPARVALTALGVAVALGALLAGAGARTLAGDEELRRALAALPPGARAVAVAYSGGRVVPAQLARREATARAALAELDAPPARRIVLLRELSDGQGGTFRIVGIDGLADVVREDAGRLPASCTATRCEAVLLGGGALPTLDPALGVEVVGQGVLADAALVGGTFDPGPGVAILAVDGVEAADRIEALGLVQRSYGWIAPLPRAATRTAATGAVLADLSAAADRAAADGLALTAPDDELRAAAATARASARRLALVVGQAAALLLGFAAVAAFGLRRGHRAALELLADRGATAGTSAAFTAAEAVLAVLPGALLGVVLGVGATALLARSAGVEAAALAGDALGGGTARSAALAIAATIALVALVLRVPDRPPARGLRPTDVAALAAAGAAVLAAARGTASAAGLAGRGDPFLALLPALVLGAAAALAARLAPPALRLAARHAPAGPVVRLALGQAARPGPRSLATVAFLAAATGASALALAYRETLARGAQEQAAFRVPLDARLTVGAALVRPRDLGAPAAYARLVPGAVAGDVVRRTASVRVAGTATGTASLLGLDPVAVQRISTWRDDLGPPPDAIAAAIRPAVPATLATTRVPDGATSLRLGVEGIGPRLALGAVIVDGDGRPHEVDADADGRVALPAGAGRALLGLRVRQEERVAQLEEHHAGEANTAVAAAAGQIRVRGVEAEPGGPLDVPWAALVTDTGAWTPEAGGGGVLDVALQGRSALLRMRQATDDLTLPAVVDEETARTARDGVLDLAVGGAVLRVRVAATARAFPTAGGRFALVDGSLLRVALDAADPGAGTPDELWIAAPGQDDALAAALAAAPYDRLDLERRTAIEADLRDDPLARAATGLLLGAGLLGIALAAGAIGIAVSATRRDEAAVLHALEADGARPRDLRRLLFLRGLALVACAVPVGALAGALLAREVARLVAVTATAETPVPALAAAPAHLVGLAAAVAGAALGGLACAAAAAAAFREPLPPSGEAALR